jgi:hypothetical protein
MLDFFLKKDLNISKGKYMINGLINSLLAVGVMRLFSWINKTKISLKIYIIFFLIALSGHFLIHKIYAEESQYFGYNDEVLITSQMPDIDESGMIRTNFKDLYFSNELLDFDFKNTLTFQEEYNSIHNKYEVKRDKKKKKNDEKLPHEDSNNFEDSGNTDIMDRQYHIKRINFHIENGMRTFENAKKCCWYFPYISDRKKANYCWEMAIATAGGFVMQSPTAAVCISIITVFRDYGLTCFNEWQYMQNQLNWSAYHWDMNWHHRDCVEYIDSINKKKKR